MDKRCHTFKDFEEFLRLTFKNYIDNQHDVYNGNCHIPIYICKRIIIAYSQDQINNQNNINNLNKLNQYNNINKSSEKLNNEIQTKETKKTNDTINISKEAVLLSKIKDANIDKNEKVSELKKLVNEGKYEIEPEKLAQKILDFEKLL